MTDRGLIEQFVRNNSQAAFSELVQRHAGLVYSTCKRDLGDAVLAEDCTQAVFLILARKAGRLVRIDNLTGWLFKTSRLAARDTIKQEARRRRREAAVMERVQTQTEREAAAWRAIEPELNDTLESMTPADRNVILMRFVEQFSHADIAQSMGIKEDAARIRVSRAVDKLRTRLLSKLGTGAGIVAGIALADLLANRAVDAASIDVAVHLTALNHWPTTSLPTASTAMPHAQSIAQGALKAMSRTVYMKTAAAVVVTVGAVAVTPLIAHANLVSPPSVRLATGQTSSTATDAVSAPAVGYTETYSIQKDGVEIGRQTGTLTSLTPAEQTWTFTINLSTAVNGRSATIAEDGTMTMSNTGFPDWVKMNANVNGIKQAVSIDFSKTPVTLADTINSTPMTIQAPYKAGDRLSINNNLTLTSINLRSIPRPDGKDLRIPFFSVDGPFSGVATWSSAGKEPITVNGKKILCSIYDMQDMQIDQQLPPVLIAAYKGGIGERIWVDAGGSLIKVSKPSDNVVVIRE